MRVKCRSVHYPDMLVVAQQYVSCDTCGSPFAMYRQAGDTTERALCTDCAAKVQAMIDRLRGIRRTDRPDVVEKDGVLYDVLPGATRPEWANPLLTKVDKP